MVTLAIALLQTSLIYPAAPLRKVVFVLSGFNDRTSLIFVAEDRHFFEEQGLDLQGRPGAQRPGGSFRDGGQRTTSKEKSRRAEYRGGIWTFSMLALDHWGLVPERDKIQFRILGDQSVIAQGLSSGTVDAAYLGYGFSKTVQRQGFRVLQDFANIDFPYQGIGIVARKTFLDQSPDVAERTLKALSRSISYCQDHANKQSLVAIVAKWLRLQNLEDAAAGCDAVRNLYNRRLFPTIAGLRNTLRILGRVDPKFGRMKAETLVDDRIVRKLEREGVFK